MPDAFMAEIDDRAPEIRGQGINRECWHRDMDTDWNEDRAQREQMYRKMLAGRDSKKIKQGIEAYKRDLPQLLRDEKQRHVVAYDGNTRVGIASTREKLLVELNQKGISDYTNLFIKVVTKPQDKRESLLSQSHS
jgi:hypothetical protein